jgi:CBS domain-containing protein
MRSYHSGEGHTEPVLHAAADRPGSGGKSAAALVREKVGDLFTPHPVTVAADMPVHDVIALMQRHQIGAVLLESHGRLAGIFSERDLINRYLGLDIDPVTPVNTLVSAADVCVQPSDELGTAIELMAQHKLRHLPVCTENKQIVGILSVRNIIDCLADHYPTEVINQPPSSGPLPSAPDGG